MNEKELILQKLAKLKPEIAEQYGIISLELFGSVARGEAVAPLCREFGVRRLDVFGSTVRRSTSSSSDVDLLVEFSRTPDLLTFIELEERIKEALGRDVDLVPRRKLRAELAGQVLKEAVAV